MKLGLREKSAMIALMACNRTVPNAELDSIYRLGLSKSQRDALNREGLVVSHKLGQRYSHELTDKGWAWVAQEMSQPMPPRSGAANGALYAVLHALGAQLKARNMTLADLFGDTLKEPQRPDEPASGTRLEDDIRSAYLDLRKRPRDWVSLTELRDRISGASRAEVDSALLAMLNTKDILLTLNEDRRSLTAADKEAAIRIGGTDMHFICME